MLKKKWVLFLAAFAVIVITAIVLLFTVFAIDDDKVTFHKHNSFSFSNQAEQAVLESSGLKKGKSVFFVNKKNVTNKVEKAFPNLKVINIETVFPNKVVFHLAQREQLFVTKNNLLNTYTVLDADFKVLNLLDGDASLKSLTTMPILLTFEGSSQINLQPGDFVKRQESENIISDLAKSFTIHGRDIVEQKHLFKEINLMGDILVIILQDGFQIRIHSPQTQLHKKVSAMFESASLIYPAYQTGYMLEVFETQDGVVLSKFSLSS